MSLFKPDQFGAVILAGGEGSRMKAGLPKVLLEVGGQPMIQRPIATLHRLGVRKIVVVVGFQGEKVVKTLGSQVDYVWQRKQLGNAHALGQAKPKFADKSEINEVFVFQGDDSFLYPPALLRKLGAYHLSTQAAITALTIGNDPKVPRYFWRLALAGSKVKRMISSQEALGLKSLAGSQALAGSYCFDNRWLWPHLDDLLQEEKPPGEEYYLPDIIPLALAQGRLVQAVPVEYGREWFGVNTSEELAEARELFDLLSKTKTRSLEERE